MISQGQARFGLIRDWSPWGLLPWSSGSAEIDRSVELDCHADYLKVGRARDQRYDDDRRQNWSQQASGR